MPKAKKQKLLIVFSTSFPRYPGDFSGSFVLEWQRSLRRLSKPYKIIYITFDDPEVRRRSLMPVFYIRLPRLFGVTGIGHGRLKAPGPFITKAPWRILGVILQLFWAYAGFIRLLFTIKRIYRQSDVSLWSHFALPCSLFAAGIARRLGIPHIATWHSSDIHLLHKLPFTRLLKRYLYNRINLIQTTSSVLQAKAGATDAVVLPVYAPDAIEPAGPNQSRPLHIGYIGSLHQVKGILPFLQTALDAGPPAPLRLTITGDGPQAVEITETVHKLKSAGWQIEFQPGRVPKDQMQAKLTSYDYLLFPSVEFAGFSEGVPVTAMEAVSFGRPILITETGGLLQLFAYGAPGFHFAGHRQLIAALPGLPKPGEPDYLKLVNESKSWQQNLKTKVMDFAAGSAGVIYGEAKGEALINS